MSSISQPAIRGAVCILPGVAFVVGAITLLSVGHVHEDAYILFQFARNFADGDGIVFDRASGPAEGATDFLWMVVLAAFSKTGLALGTCAALLNGLGLAAISAVVVKLRRRVDVVSVSAIAVILFSGGTAASVGGFSALAYGGAFSCLVYAALCERNVLAVALGLLLGLIRPDGVVLAAGTVLAMLLTARSEQRETIYLAIGTACLIGGGYFLWRSSYFGQWLPLPLIVKSQASSAYTSIKASLRAVAPYLLFVFPFVYVRFSDRSAFVLRREFWLILSGPILLLMALSLAHQSQNHGNRFQFPIVVGLVLFFVESSKAVTSWRRPIPGMLLAAASLLALVNGVHTMVKSVAYLTNNDYINALPQLLRRNGFEAREVAVTEAGRFPYWYNTGRMTDLVGLNTVEAALHGSAAVLEAQEPALIFVHHADQYDTAGLSAEAAYVVMDPTEILLKGNYSGRNPAMIAPRDALRFAQKHRYKAVLVRYGVDDAKFFHAYFLAPSLDFEGFKESLTTSLHTKLSYYDSERLHTSNTKN